MKKLAKMGRSSKSDDVTTDEQCATINVGVHRVSSRVEADGSAEAVISNDFSSPLFQAAPITRTLSAPLDNSSIPLSRTISNPLGGMSYAIKRVLSHDDRGRHSAVPEEESEGLVSSRVKGVYRKGGIETELDDYHLRPPPIVRKSSLSSAFLIKKVFSKKEDEWQHEETDEFVESSSDHADKCNNGNSLKGGYRFRQVHSTPLQGIENSYALKRNKTSGYEQQQHQSSLYEEERIRNPLSLLRSRSIGQTGGKEVSNGNDDDFSTIVESIESFSTSSSASRQQKKRRRSKYFVLQLIVAVIIISSGVAGTAVYLLRGGSNDNTDDVSTIVMTAEGSGEAAALDKPSEIFAADGVPSKIDEPSPINDVISEESNDALVVSDETPLSVADVKPASELVVANLTNTTNDSDVNEEETTVISKLDNLIANVDEDSNSYEEETVDGNAIVTTDKMDVDHNVDQNITTAQLSATTTITPTELPPIDTITTFYVMADAPYTDEERYNIMPKHIEELSDDAEFLVHLGDLQFAKVDKCREGAYDEASTIMNKSRIPTFILPGDNDINDCNSMTHGEEMWTKYFALFDRKFDHSLQVTRWGKLNESFSFIHKEVLYLGLNIIGGKPASNIEKSIRHSQHLDQIRSIMKDHLDEFKIVVLLGHAEPSQHHEDFFGGDTGFISIMKEMEKPTIHFHGDWHAYYEREAEYGVEDYMRISLDGESRAPPILVTIDTSKKNPVKFSRRSDNLAVACCSEGWPR